MENKDNSRHNAIIQIADKLVDQGKILQPRIDNSVPGYDVVNWHSRKNNWLAFAKDGSLMSLHYYSDPEENKTGFILTPFNPDDYNCKAVVAHIMQHHEQGLRR